MIEFGQNNHRRILFKHLYESWEITGYGHLESIP